MTDREVLELCKSWFEEISEKCSKLTSGNVSHNSKYIRGLARGSAEFIDDHFKETKDDNTTSE